MWQGLMNSFTAQYFLSDKTKSTKAKKKTVIWEMVNIKNIWMQLRKVLAAHLEFFFTNSVYSCHLQDRDLS